MESRTEAGSSTLEYNLKFNTLAAGTSTIGIDTYEVYDEDGAAINVTHLGTSTVTVNSAEQLSQDADLATLEVSPGTLRPSDPSVTSYTTTVGDLGRGWHNAGRGSRSLGHHPEQRGPSHGTEYSAGKSYCPDGQTVKDYDHCHVRQGGRPGTPVSDA